MNPPASYDVIVIGGGPAGACCAHLLAKADFRVALIEKEKFPRDKVCGECVSRLGVAVLEAIGLADELKRELRPVPLRFARVHAMNGSSAEFELPAAMWAISRRAFDAHLLDRAREAGAIVLQPAVADHLTSGDGVTVNINENGARRTLDAKLAVVADGKSALGFAGKQKLTGDFGIKAHFSDIDAPSDAIELFGFDGHYGGVAPVEDGAWNVSISVPAKRLRKTNGDLDALLWELRAENKMLGQRLCGAQRKSGWLATPLPRFAVRRDWHACVVPIGNAAAAIEPIGGEGIGLALASAKLAAEAIITALQHAEPIDVTRLCGAYKTLWRRRRIACRAAALAVSRPAVAAYAVEASHISQLNRTLMNWVGKTA